ncbi:MAG: DUF4149 domain-containing protein [Sulfurospirillum sp.]|nr:DUF4149 domain-containing protein [Sulfurospirillum sp.]MBP9612661.1 DUF4149 domain-containing protein [Sulfurospirillum sp.]
MKSLVILYVTFLGIALGVEVAAGAFIAPVIFFPHKYLGEGVLSHFQSGILMTQVFLKTNMLLMIVAVYSLFFEIISWIKKRNNDVFSSVCALLGVGLTAIFVFYHTPFIVEAQGQGALATATEAFDTMHKQSEVVMKSLMVIQLSLLFRRVWLIQK